MTEKSEESFLINNQFNPLDLQVYVGDWGLCMRSPSDTATLLSGNFGQTVPSFPNAN